jgi:SAM-dependent methyltransferase
MNELDKAAESAELPPRLALFQLVTGHYISRAIYVAAKLNIADLLADGPRHFEELATAAGAHGPSLNRLMRLLASAGVFAETDIGTFALTPMGDCLRSGTPGSSRATALLFAGPLMCGWDELLHSIKTGETTFQRALGMDPFVYMAKHPEEAAVFNEAMTAVSTHTARGVPVAYDFSAFETVVDAGGGHGALLVAILLANPSIRGILFELPYVAEGARQAIANLGLSERCQVVAGDFFESVPSGADAYILKSVIHDWDDAKCVKILQNCHRAMAPGGKLLLVELVLPERVDQSPRAQIGTGSDVNMLVNVGGRERTDADFEKLFAASGFKLTKIVGIPGSLSSVIEGERVSLQLSNQLSNGESKDK